MVTEFKKIKIPQGSSKTDKKTSGHSEGQKASGKKKSWPGKLKFLLIPVAIILVILIIAGIVVGLSFKPLLASGQKTYASVNEAYQAIKKQDLVTAGEKLKSSEDNLKEIQQRYQRLSWLKFVPFVSAYFKDGQHALTAGSLGLEAGKTLIDAITPYADVLGFKGQGSFMGGTAEERVVKIVQTLEKVTPKIDEVTQKLALAETELEYISPQRYPEEFKGKKIRENVIKAKTLVKDVATGVNEAKPMINVLPQILGYPDKKTYLMIFQNDGELRATGGFMTAYAVLKLESGKFIPEKSDDIYSLDKKLKSRIKPPDPIKKYLFSSDLNTGIVPYYYLRDMNFSPDFKVAMSTFKENYDKIPGEAKIEGIIALDTKVLTDLVKILGPIDVGDYGKFTVEPDKRCHNIPNIICELEYIVDEPLPTQSGNRKQSILGPMMKQILLKSMGSAKQLWPQLFSTGINLLKEKHMLLYFTDSKIQEGAEAFGAAGRITDFDGDYLHINDSNFGGAKSNLFTKQEVEQEIEVSDSGTITKSLTIVYEDPEEVDNCNLERKSGLCLNSILRNYLRVYVPKGSKLLENLGSEVPMETKEELGKTYFDGFVTVRGGGGRAKVVLKYELPFKLSQNDKYRLLIQKQPGTLNPKYKVSFGEQTEEFELLTDKKLEFAL